MSAWGTACTGNKFPFRGTCLSQSSQEKVGQHLAFFFFNKYTHIQRCIWAQSLPSKLGLFEAPPSGPCSAQRLWEMIAHPGSGSRAGRPAPVELR